MLGGVNLRHSTTGADGCGCHGGVAQISESDVPPYYGTAATSLEDWRMCLDNLDNDGDLFADGDDSDCDGVSNDDRSWTVIKDYYGSE